MGHKTLNNKYEKMRGQVVTKCFVNEQYTPLEFDR